MSLNQFINLAVAEKLAHLEHEDWLQRRAKPATSDLSTAFAILSRGQAEPDAADEIPIGYQPVEAPE